MKRSKFKFFSLPTYFITATTCIVLYKLRQQQHPQKNIRTDFQASSDNPARNTIFAKLKKNDGQALVNLLTQNDQFNNLRRKKSPIVVTDIGGGEGCMLPFIMQLAAQFVIHINEPNQQRAAQYAKLVQDTPQTDLGEVSTAKIEKSHCQVPPSDLILASHSLYYTQSLWSNAQQDFEEHLLSKLLKSLNQEGVLAVVLQSSEQATKTANHEALEEVVYPLITESSTGIATANKARTSYTNAELFVQALKQYNHQYHQHTGGSLQWATSAPIITAIHLQDINFKFDQQTNSYPQNETITAFFNFYTRNLYQHFTPTQQKKFLDFIQQHCQESENNYTITHINKVIVINKSNEQFSLTASTQYRR